ncbi:MAG: glycoside hydrolase family 127 protein, partial [Janthinobacterium lividum]
MSTTPRTAASPVELSDTSHAPYRPAAGGLITGGLWAERRRVNREVSVPDAWDKLHQAGNFHNLELAAGRRSGDYVNDLPFLDSDVYKWLEAVAYTLEDPDLSAAAADRLRDLVDQTVALLEEVQQPDGYLDSYFQVHHPGQRFAALAWGHELYCAGHLIQAAVAFNRIGDARLLAIAVRFADLVVDTFGTAPGQVDGICGHPEIESALVELYRETGRRAYLETAGYFIDRRGHGLLDEGRFGRQYWQDHEPVRQARSVEGHAVRQLYLLAGVADVHLETGEQALGDAAERLWHEMVATRTYITGGIGSHHLDEAFGDPYELPSERSYCETCAAIASVMFSWRMLMITGEARYADLVERTLYNGFLAGLSLDGERFIYANPLQVREGHLVTGGDGDFRRVPWFHCACCPPNVMRTLASLEHYVVLGSDDEILLHQYIPGSYTVELADGQARFTIATSYPSSGKVDVEIVGTPTAAWTLAIRVPQWAGTFSLVVNETTTTCDAEDGWARVRRVWTEGDRIELEVALKPRFTRAQSRVDA